MLSFLLVEFQSGPFIWSCSRLPAIRVTGPACGKAELFGKEF
jgi:hypothetical protein